MLECHQLSIRVGNKVLLDNINWRIQPSKVNAIIGLNGAGKSTLIAALSGQCLPNSGEVLLHQRPLATFTATERADHLALVSQQHEPPSALLVEDILALGCLPPLGTANLREPDVRRAVDYVSTLFNLTAFRQRRFNVLSGGEQQRVLMAQAWAQRTPIMLLDEPTNHLDVAQQLTLLDRLTNSDKTLVIALHDINLARHYSDYLLVLEQGKVLASGPTEAILDKDLLKRLYGRTFVALEHPALAMPWFAPETDHLLRNNKA